MEPTALRPPQHGRQFLLGLGLGAIPLVVWLLLIGWAVGLRATCTEGPLDCPYAGLDQLLEGLIAFAFGWVIQLFATVIVLRDAAKRFVGYGLLAMLLVGPIVGSIACINVPNFAR